MKNFTFSSLLLVPLFAVLSACGGGGGDAAPATPTTPAVATLKSIAVAVPSATMPVGASQTLVATGTYSDGSTKVLNTASGLAWTTKSGGALVVQAFSTGIVAAKAVGTETINATQDTIVGSVTLTVNAPWTQVSAGGNQTIARKADGNLYSWGSNIAGQLGDGSSTNRNAPVVVSGGNVPVWRQVSVGEQFAVGIKAGSGTATATGGTLWAWGFNQNGRLGDGTQIARSAPVQIGKDTDWAFVAAGKAHVLAIKTNGFLYAWGRNDKGQLGDATVIDKLVPTRITTTAVPVATWLAVSAGETHSLGIQKDGSLWAWGGNVYGQVGNAGRTDVIAGPVKIGTLTWTSVSAGAFHSAAIRADGTLYAWGQNTSGQLGNNGSADVTAPVQIDTVNNWSVVSAGALHTMGVRNDGTLWGWGSNAEGQLGDGGVDVSSPLQIGTRTNWTTVSAGAGHSFGMQSDNSLWGWGRNTEGQLGNSRNTTSPVPVNVPN